MPWLPPILALAATAVPHLAAARADKPPVLDGRLDDAVWQKAPASGRVHPEVAASTASPRGIARWCASSTTTTTSTSASTARRASRWWRGSRGATDGSRRTRSPVVLDTRGDGKSAFEFAINAAGVLADALHFNDTDFNQDWDENWEGEGRRAPPAAGRAELRIPLRALRFPARRRAELGPPGAALRLGPAGDRRVGAHPKEAAGEVSHYGRLDDLVGLAPRRRSSCAPSSSGTMPHHDPAGTTARARRASPSGDRAGLDLKWHVSQSLTLDATILPDFGQVEADQVILNLTTYEIYYPEKRPFFLEGVETFSTPIQLLYTRRIGRAPRRARAHRRSRPAARAARRGARTPPPSTARPSSSGDLGGHWTFGELVAVTGRQTVAGAGAERRRRSTGSSTPTRPTRCSASSASIGDNAHVGLMFTATNRLESSRDYPSSPASAARSPRCPSVIAGAGPDCKPDGRRHPSARAPGSRCFHDAYVAGVDGRWRSPSGDYIGDRAGDRHADRERPPAHACPTAR